MPWLVVLEYESQPDQDKVGGSEKVAYVENVAGGDQLPDMPIFLTPDHYVPCPLEASYQVTWGVFPSALEGPLELPPK